MRFWRVVAVILAVVLLLFFVPLPVLVFGPGGAVDLDPIVSVPGKTPPPGKLYLTDVTVMPGRPVTWAAGKILPGYEIVPRRQFAGSESDSQYDTELADAMKESQTVAQIVAERAAGLAVKTKTVTTVASVSRTMPAAHCFKPGDVIVALEGRTPTGPDSVPAVVGRKPPGTTFHLEVERDGKRVSVACRTALYKGAPRFGIIISTNTLPVALPVHVSYDVRNINGSSAGLMFALQIYRELTGVRLAGGRDIAGTGVLAADGTVFPVGGARQKLQAAIDKRAAIFLVPKVDFPSISGVKGITIVPVASFSDALKKLASQG